MPGYVANKVLFDMVRSVCMSGGFAVALLSRAVAIAPDVR